jgi:chorismate mutase
MEDTSLDLLRKEIHNIDDELINLLVRRFQYSYMIGMEKKKQKLPIISVHNFKISMDKYRKGLGRYGEEIYHLLHDISKKIQEDEANNI